MIIRAMQRSREERGLKVSTPNRYLSDSHLKKGDHNLIVMTDLNKFGHEDWTVISAYYAMYQAATALLVRIGLESKDHATTAAVLEYFFDEQINKEIIKKFNELKEEKDKIEAITINEKYIDYLWKVKRARETVQYGVSINYHEAETVMTNARAFVNKIKLVLHELDEKLVLLISKRVEELKKESEKNIL